MIVPGRAEDVLTFGSPAKKVCCDLSSPPKHHVPEPAAVGEVLHGHGGSLHDGRADVVPGGGDDGVRLLRDGVGDELEG